MNTPLQAELDTLEPTLKELAQHLGQTPEQVLRDAIEAKKKECAQSKPSKAVVKAPIPSPKGSLSSEVRRHTAQRNAKMGQK